MPQPTVESTGTVTATGTGKADYTKVVKAAIQRSGYKLDYNETLKLFFLTPSSLIGVGNPYSWVTDPIAAGGSAHLIDMATGDATPYTLPEGYGLTVVDKSIVSSTPAIFWLYMDTFLIACLMQNRAYDSIYINDVISYTTLWLDPTGASAHYLDVVVANQDGVNALEGGITIKCILKAVGTPPLPKSKVIRCHNCGNLKEVPVETTSWICERCGQLCLFINERALREG